MLGGFLNFNELVPFYHLQRGSIDTCQKHPGDTGMEVGRNLAQVLFSVTLFSFPIILFCYLYTTCTLFQIQKILEVYNEK